MKKEIKSFAEYTKDNYKTLYNEGEKNILKHHLETLQNLAGAEAEIQIKNLTAKEQVVNDEFVTRLKELFGDKVEIV